MSIFLSSPKKCVGVGCFNAPIFNFLNANVREILVARKKKWAGRGGDVELDLMKNPLQLGLARRKTYVLQLYQIYIYMYMFKV